MFGPPTKAIKSKPLNLTFEIPNTKTSKFWDGLKAGKILATKCTKCGELLFPPSADCSNCLSSEMSWVEISGEGEVETFSHIVVRPSSFSEHETYTVAVAKLKEGVKALAWLSGVKLGDAKVGMKVKLVPKNDEDGLAYELVPLNA